MTSNDALYPFEANYLDVDGGRLHYLDEGEGSPVVMVHGNPSWSFYYRELVKALSPSHRCIVPDHIGCGRSDKPGDDAYDYTLGRRIDDLEKLLDTVEPDRPVTLIVHDWGGAIGMGWAARHPERVARLVLLNTGAFRNPKGLGLPPTVWLARNTPIGTLMVRGFNAFAWGAARFGVMKKLTPEVYRGLTGPYDSWANRIATLRFVQDIPLGPDDPAWAPLLATEEGLAQFTATPTLICWGEKANGPPPATRPPPSLKLDEPRYVFNEPLPYKSPFFNKYSLRITNFPVEPYCSWGE